MRPPKLIFLGTGGATMTPKPGCCCRICRKVRVEILSQGRLGPGLFVRGPNVLFDTPEQLSIQLNREGIRQVAHIFYTHWHPDHTQGLLALEQLNLDWRRSKEKRVLSVTDVYLPIWVKRDFDRHLGLTERLRYLEDLGIVRTRVINECETVHLRSLEIQAYPMAHRSLTAYLLRKGSSKVILALDDTKGWIPPEVMKFADLAVLETGWFDRDARGKPILPARHPMRETESSFLETLELIGRLQPKRVILTHIEELNARSSHDYSKLEDRYRRYRLKFAYDGMRVAL